MDYRLTDAIADPPGDPDRFHGKLIRWNTISCYRPPDEAPDVAPGPGPFGGACHLRIVQQPGQAYARDGTPAGPESRIRFPAPGLVLKFGPRSIDVGVADRIRKQFANQGVTPERLDLVARDATTRDHLARYGTIDIGLDPSYNGTTTTCEALWMGCR
ncbi:MAG: hypothetical protein U1E97_07140 [Alphaproteobacteria bacterium]